MDFFRNIFENLDSNNIGFICETIVASLSAYKISSLYATRKEYIPKDISTILKTPRSNLLYNEFKDNPQYVDIITTFIYNLFKHFNAEDLTNFWNNITTLSIEIKEKLPSSPGYYIYNYDDLNKIEIEKQIVFPSIYHELFHVSSTNRSSKDIAFSGFCQIRNNLSIGRGLTEGYTELLTQRYFGTNKDEADSYIYLSIIAGYLELMVGKEKMQSLYLNADLLGLITELGKYISEKEIMKFIASTDFLFNHLDSKPKILEKNMILENLRIVNKSLIIFFVKKNLILSKDNIISNHDAGDNIASFINKLPKIIKTNGITYNVMDDEFTQNAINVACNDFNHTNNKNYHISLKK